MNWLRSFIEKFRMNGKQQDAIKFEVFGNPMQCQACKHRYFYRHPVKLNKRLTGLLKLEWIDRDANCAVCARCGFMHWFLPNGK